MRTPLPFVAFGALVGTGTMVPARERSPSYHLRVRGEAVGKEKDRPSTRELAPTVG
jgi:hypothetical protein